MIPTPNPNKNRPFLWLLAICLPALVGCGEVLNEYYLSNNTQLDLSIQLIPTSAGNVELLSGPLQSGLNSSARDELTEAHAATEDGDSYLFVLPPGTTILLGSSTGGNDLFEYLEISGGT